MRKVIPLARSDWAEKGAGWSLDPDIVFDVYDRIARDERLLPVGIPLVCRKQVEVVLEAAASCGYCTFEESEDTNETAD